MRVPAHIRFTLAELIAFGLQSADVLARANSAIHLVLTEQQEGLPSSGAQDECSIISVEDTDGITVAVTKHPRDETWDRRVKEERSARLKLPEPPPGSIMTSCAAEPLVPRRGPPGKSDPDRFRRGEVPEADMHFCGEPTADGDNAAEYLRVWYEANRETLWERRQRPPLNNPWADNLMLGLYEEVLRIERERLRQISEIEKRKMESGR